MINFLKSYFYWLNSGFGLVESWRIASVLSREYYAALERMRKYEAHRRLRGAK